MKRLTQLTMVLGLVWLGLAPGTGEAQDTPAPSESSAEDRVHAGAFLQFTRFGEGARCVCAQPSNGTGFGARGAWSPHPYLRVEADAQTTLTDRVFDDGSVRYTTASLRAGPEVQALSWEGVRIAIVAGVGPTRGWYDGEGRWGLGIQGGLLLRQSLDGIPLSLRVDALADRFRPDRATNLGVRIGGDVRVW